MPTCTRKKKLPVPLSLSLLRETNSGPLHHHPPVGRQGPPQSSSTSEVALAIQGLSTSAASTAPVWTDAANHTSPPTIRQHAHIQSHALAHIYLTGSRIALLNHPRDPNTHNTERHNLQMISTTCLKCNRATSESSSKTVYGTNIFSTCCNLSTIHVSPVDTAFHHLRSI